MPIKSSVCILNVDFRRSSIFQLPFMLACRKSARRKLTAFAILLLGSAWAMAWDGAVSGKISRIDTITEANNYELRVYLGWQTMCNVSNPDLSGWAYLNSSDPNYKATVANLMMAYATGKNVYIYSMNDSGLGCHIHYVVVNG